MKVLQNQSYLGGNLHNFVASSSDGLHTNVNQRLVMYFASHARGLLCFSNLLRTRALFFNENGLGDSRVSLGLQNKKGGNWSNRYFFLRFRSEGGAGIFPYICS